ncbi:MAG: DNA translocase FtsK [Patescibacteria group bacterium]|nr:DNA translocase FtsK [Patescibacteria group bacterium]
MAKKKNRNRGNGGKSSKPAQAVKEPVLHPELKLSIWAIVSMAVALILLLSSAGQAGPAGGFLFNQFFYLLGLGYYLLPLILFIVGIALITDGRKKLVSVSFIGAFLFLLSGLGLFGIIFPAKAGVVGEFLAGIQNFFGYWASIAINLAVLVIGLLVSLNTPLRLRVGNRLEEEGKKGKKEAPLETQKIIMPGEEAASSPAAAESPKKEELKVTSPAEEPKESVISLKQRTTPRRLKNYVFPPLSLLKSSTDKPTVGDLRANANIIKRTLESFGIPVEMGEITIGPKVTRYTLKPAEGIKLTRITALGQDLSLALAAHPIRIEAPIPGKSLVGIEIPNKIPSIVRLGNLLSYREFSDSPALSVPLGRDVAGEPIFANLAKMPHLLIAGATGSGKSVTIHSLLISLLYKNSPETLRLILIDPKKVELTPYEGLPHLVAPVITQGKKAVAALRFGVEEMERRYDVLQQAGKRDIGSYNEKREEDAMPYMVIVIDELADLMAAFGREIEGYIVRLAQMARATGIHLVVSTQRPSVEVITGLIKANITSRVALQVASQIDSRTILDMAGAEKLLGGGDMLFLSSDYSKPKRIQSAFISEEEISKVAQFIKKENPDDGSASQEDQVEAAMSKAGNAEGGDDEDDMLDEAINVVKEAKKASASLLQRRLRVGYARAARLLDLMEDRGIIGPGEGAKPREVYITDEDGAEHF